MAILDIPSAPATAHTADNSTSAGTPHTLSDTLIRRFLAGETDAGSLPEPPWGAIGREVYERTYSRDIPVTGAGGAVLGTRKEVWAETVRRVVMGSLSLVDPVHWHQTEDVDLFRLIYEFKAVPAGRHLWVTGTESAHMSRNCWAAGFSERTSGHFRFTAARLFEGGGVGANYSSDVLSVTTPICGRVHVRVACRPDHPDIEKVVAAAGDRFVTLPLSTPDTFTVAVPDTREGWVDAWAEVIDTACEPGTYTVVVDVSDLRPAGSPLKTFGGTASGPEALVRSLCEITEVLAGASGQNRRLTGMEAMAIDHAIAASVVAGGTRRSARISLMSWTDLTLFHFISCKSDHMHHWTTNISVEIDDEFHAALADPAHPMAPRAERVLAAVAAGMAANGEPGFVDTSAHSADEPEPVRIVNPCVIGDTMVKTSVGPRMVSDLVGTGTVTLVIDGRITPTTDEGFFQTGVRETVLLLTGAHKVLGVTPDHLVLTPDGWVPAGELKVGDKVTADNGGTTTIMQVASGRVEPVYDCVVPDGHAFVADGVVVHNCGEASLNSYPINCTVAGESCNLGSVNLAAFGTDHQGAVRAFELMARFLYRATLTQHLDPAAMVIEAENRRIGVGIMGLQGWAAAHGYRLSELPASAYLQDQLTDFRFAVRVAANQLADELGTPRPVKVTAVAPTGTIAQLSGTTPGIHPVFARYFIRRVRFSDHDPQLAEHRAAGHRVIPDIYAADTSVVEFVVRDSILDHYPASLIEQADEIGVEQFLDIIACVQETFCGTGDGQAVSATAQIPTGTDPTKLAQAITERIGRMKGFTVFPATSRPLAPYETISEDQYLAAEESGLVMAGGDSNSGECAGGSCPVR
jgi:ribonucleotide reductase alpha subunit